MKRIFGKLKTKSCRICELIDASIERTMVLVIPFIRERDLALATLELGLTMSLYNILWQLNSLGPDGKPIAPFLESAVSLLLYPKWVWNLILCVTATIKLVCLIHGFVHNNFFRYRGWASFCGCIVWCLLWTAPYFSDQPKVTVTRYMIGCFLSLMTYFILSLKQTEAARNRSYLAKTSVNPIQSEVGCGDF